MKKVLFVLAMIPALALAGKAEREFMTKEVVPAKTEAEAKVKEACGCGVTMKVNEATLGTKDEMREVRRIFNSVTEGAPKYCTDADSKKAICKMKTLEAGKGKETKFWLEGTKGMATTDGQSYPSWDMMTAQLDK